MGAPPILSPPRRRPASAVEAPLSKIVRAGQAGFGMVPPQVLALLGFWIRQVETKAQIGRGKVLPY